MGAYWIKTRIAQWRDKIKNVPSYAKIQVNLEAKEKTLAMIEARVEDIEANDGKLYMTEVEAMNYISQAEHAKVRCEDWVSKKQWVEVVNGVPVLFNFRNGNTGPVDIRAYPSTGRGDVANWVVYEENNL